ncbi:hypothetical protein L249_3071 [Ophiocordyceps polyrhachis-furcata BCC 54312]|uniref:N-acetyltransferase domain-containing protein n=1 Tax=Ophiocordyceps polyrhachis-furcata BCC 54312 TaxID=1330021 RepID=A0A367LRD1_9HYPO|nr:hypothetical protein L249_3071 [Ophiocordyceps polyrhachis-furcata BCC 54312]
MTTTAAHSLRIRPAKWPDDLEAIRACFNAYVNWLGEDLSFQGYANELNTLPGLYAPPAGALLLAVDAVSHDRVLGCVAVRPLEPGPGRRRACEMKRLFVWPEVRGRGISRALVRHVVRTAEEAGYHEMLLDTLPRMSAAIGLYTSEGFVPTEPYYHNPLGGTIYMAKRLGCLDT